MKTKITHEHVKEMILLGLLTLGVAGVFYWSLLSPRRTSTARPTAPALVALPRGLSATSVVFFPRLQRVPILPFGPVAGAADATSRAVMAANDTALKDYGVEPFADAQATAIFDGRRWSWRKRVGCGRGDFEAEVTIAPGGTVESVTVRYTTQQLAQRF